MRRTRTLARLAPILVTMVAALTGLTAARQQEAAPAPEDPKVTGHVDILRQFPSKHVEPRNVEVWLPPGYDTSRARYPVLYVHDGQNVFDPATAYTWVTRKYEGADHNELAWRARIGTPLTFLLGTGPRDRSI